MMIALYILIGTVVYTTITAISYVLLLTLYENQDHTGRFASDNSPKTQATFGGVLWPILLIPFYIIAKSHVVDNRLQREWREREAEAERLLRQEGIGR